MIDGLTDLALVMVVLLWFGCLSLIISHVGKDSDSKHKDEDHF